MTEQERDVIAKVAAEAAELAAEHVARELGARAPHRVGSAVRRDAERRARELLAAIADGT